MFDHSTNYTAKERQRQIIQQDIDNFLVRGGKVESLPTAYIQADKNYSQTWYNEPLLADIGALKQA